MKELDLQHLFYDSPYPVKLDDGEYVFRTDYLQKRTGIVVNRTAQKRGFVQSCCINFFWQKILPADCQM